MFRWRPWWSRIAWNTRKSRCVGLLLIAGKYWSKRRRWISSDSRFASVCRRNIHDLLPVFEESNKQAGRHRQQPSPSDHARSHGMLAWPAHTHDQHTNTTWQRRQHAVLHPNNDDSFLHDSTWTRWSPLWLMCWKYPTLLYAPVSRPNEYLFESPVFVQSHLDLILRAWRSLWAAARYIWFCKFCLSLCRLIHQWHQILSQRRWFYSAIWGQRLIHCTVLYTCYHLYVCSAIHRNQSPSWKRHCPAALSLVFLSELSHSDSFWKEKMTWRCSGIGLCSR